MLTSSTISLKQDIYVLTGLKFYSLIGLINQKKNEDMTFSPKSTSHSRSEKPEAHDAMMSSFKRSFNAIIFQAMTTMHDYKGSMQARRSQTDVSQLTYCRGHSRVSVETEFYICAINGLRGDVSCRATRGLVSHSMIILEI